MSGRRITTRFNDKKSKVMLVSRRKRKENKNIIVYLNNKKLKPVTQIKYLGIIMDHKFRFQDHITYAAERCTKLIHSLSKVAKMTWGSNTRQWPPYTKEPSYLYCHTVSQSGLKQ